MVFRDREDAGRRLAGKLKALHLEQPVVLGLPRGGVLVGWEVARELNAPLEVLVVRKISAPSFPEFAVGAVAEGGAVFVSHDALGEVGLSESDLPELAERAAQELGRRVLAYRGHRTLPELAGRVVVLVDDGVATGATARAACRAVRELGARRVVFAAPVVSQSAAQVLSQEIDDLVAGDVPPEFFAVGYWYVRFPQVTDEEVSAVLEHARAGRPTVAPASPPVRTAERPFLAEGETLSIPVVSRRFETMALEATLAVPPAPRGLVLVVPGETWVRDTPLNRYAASVLCAAGYATVRVDLLTADEKAEREGGGRPPDLGHLAARIGAVTRWLGQNRRTQALRLGYAALGQGAAVALLAAGHLPERVAAIVCWGGRLDLVPPASLARVRAPSLLLAGSLDERTVEVNEAALPHLPTALLTVVPGAARTFDEPSALAAVARLATDWFERHLSLAQALVAT